MAMSAFTYGGPGKSGGRDWQQQHSARRDSKTTLYMVCQARCGYSQTDEAKKKIATNEILNAWKIENLY